MQTQIQNTCGICLNWGHTIEQCKGQCNICQKWGHTQKDCFKSVEKIEAKKAKIKAKNKARKAKAKITKPESPKACFNLSLTEYEGHLLRQKIFPGREKIIKNSRVLFSLR